jgi:hypothetical protein
MASDSQLQNWFVSSGCSRNLQEHLDLSSDDAEVARLQTTHLLFVKVAIKCQLRNAVTSTDRITSAWSPNYEQKGWERAFKNLPHSFEISDSFDHVVTDHIPGIMSFVIRFRSKTFLIIHAIFSSRLSIDEVVIDHDGLVAAQWHIALSFHI